MQLAYYDVLVDLFKNDETALRNMEHAELIAIGTENSEVEFICLRTITDKASCQGRPSIIRPGKPVYKYVFQRLVSGTPQPFHLHPTVLTIPCVLSQIPSSAQRRTSR